MTAGAEAARARRAERESANVSQYSGTLLTHVSRVKPVLLESRADAKLTHVMELCCSPAQGGAGVGRRERPDRVKGWASVIVFVIVCSDGQKSEF